MEVFMKRMFLILIIAASTFSGCTKELSDAASDQNLLVSVTGNGTYTSVTLSVTNLSNETKSFTVPAGIVISSGNPRAQRMVIAIDKKIVIQPRGSVVSVIPAFCMDFHRDNPSNADLFNISDYSRTKVYNIGNLLTHLKKVNYNLDSHESRSIAQKCVWLFVEDLNHERYLQSSLARQLNISTSSVSQTGATSTYWNGLRDKIIRRVGLHTYNRVVKDYRKNYSDEISKVNTLLKSAGINVRY